MKLNIVYNNYINNYKENFDKLIEIVQAYKINYKAFNIDAMEYFGDITLVLGGDGTILRVAKFYAKDQIPVIGINLGRLGFLSQINDYNLKNLLEAIVSNKIHVENRLMLESKGYFALNDFVIKGCDSTRTSKFYLEINGETVCDYIADGIIVSTPTGSTAYGLSAGGPVLHPSLDVITIVPICPHTLNSRPLVVPSNSTITIRTGDKPLSMAIDGYESEKCIDKVTITKSELMAKLAFINQEGFYSVIRNKLNWGISPKKD